MAMNVSRDRYNSKEFLTDIHKCIRRYSEKVIRLNDLSHGCKIHDISFIVTYI